MYVLTRNLPKCATLVQIAWKIRRAIGVNSFFLFSIQFMITWMTGFKPQISGDWSECLIHWAATTALFLCKFFVSQIGRKRRNFVDPTSPRRTFTLFTFQSMEMPIPKICIVIAPQIFASCVNVMRGHLINVDWTYHRRRVVSAKKQ